jgi:hypothetical protein
MVGSAPAPAPHLIRRFPVRGLGLSGTSPEPRRFAVGFAEAVMTTSKMQEASADQFKPPASVSRNASRGLRLREVFGRGGTDVGRRRAEQLSRRDPLTADDIVDIVGYFARHSVDKQAKGHAWGDLNDPSAGFIAWLLWGGDEGQAWASRVKARLAAAALPPRD